jgi:response regulator RpfG family c-di-GMP phosphodiesterase
MSDEDAQDELRRGVGTQFHPGVVDALLTALAGSPAGHVAA